MKTITFLKASLLAMLFVVNVNVYGQATENDGSKEKPYTVADVISLNNTKKGPFYVKGYIVGQIVGELSKAAFSAPWETANNNSTQNTNLVIADNADETNTANIIPVQLPSGDLRDALNLPENPDLHKKEILIYGNLEAYFSVPGIKSPTYAVVGDTEVGTNPDAPVVEPEATPVTVAEFIAAPESKDVYYELTGTIGGTINTKYGNFDLTDETGTVYVYGLTATYIPGGVNDQSYASLGLKEGDKITIRGYRGSYNGKIEVMGAYFVKKADASALHSTNISNMLYFDGKVINNLQGVDVMVYNLTGALVASGNGNIDMANEAAGVYIVRTQNATLKIVKQ